MAKYLIWLLFLLGTNNVFAQSCYCTTSWSYNATFGQSCTANADCWACQQGAYNTSWQQAFCPSIYPAPQVCNTEVQFQTQSCPVNFSGIITQSRTKICPQNVWGEWQTTSNTCVQNPPTCQTQSQTQTLSCQTGYTGSIIQTRSSTCPNPYGQPVWQPWVTTSNSCVKSVTNPTNVTSPVSPVSPVNQVTPVSQTPTSTATVSTSPDVQNSVTTQITSPTLSTKSTAQETPTPKETPKDVPKLNVKTLPLALSLELFSKPAFNQPNVFSDLNIAQELPNDIKIMQQIYMDLITNGSLFNTDQSGLLNRITSDQVELEQ
jgi:hypothetical protein